MANKIKGIFIAIELDEASLKKSVGNAVSSLQTEFNKAKEGLKNALDIDTSRAEKSLREVATALATLKNAAATQESAKAFTSLLAQSETLGNSLEDVAKKAGVTGEEMKNAFARSLDATRVNETVKAFNTYVKTLGLSNEEALEHAQKLGIVGTALDRITEKYKKVAVEASSSFEKVARNISTLVGKDYAVPAGDISKAADVAKVQQIVDSFNQYVRLLGLSNEEAIEHAGKLGIVGAALDKISEKYRKVSVDAGTQLKNLTASITAITGSGVSAGSVDVDRAIDTSKVKQLVDLMEQYKVVLGLSNSEVVEHAQKLGIAGAALDRIRDKYVVVAKTAKDKLNEAAESLKNLTGKDIAFSEEQFGTANATQKMRQIAEQIHRIQNLLNLSDMEVRQFTKSIGLSADEMRELEAAMGRVQGKSKGLFSGIANLMTGGNAMAALQSALATLGANISVAGFTELGKSMVSTTMKVDSLRTAFNSIYKDAATAGAQLDYVRSVTDELGLEFYGTAEAAKGFFAAAESSKIKGNANEIFHAFSAASSALKLTQEQTNGVFLAISQMMSKGKISAEEMRQQLAERLPGAVQLLADAMGVSLEELDKMFESGEVGLENLVLLARKVEEIFGDAGREASKSLLGEMNKMKSAWTDFKTEFIDTGLITKGIKLAQETIVSMKENIGALQVAAKGFLVVWASSLSTKAFTAIGNISSIVANSVTAFTRATTAAKGFRAAMVALTAPIGGLAGVLGVVTAALGYFWVSSFSGSDKAIYSIDELKKGLKGVGDAADDSAQSIDGATEKMRGFMSLRLVASISESKREIEGLIESFNNLGKVAEEEGRVATSSFFTLKEALKMGLGVDEYVERQKKLSEISKQILEISESGKKGKLSNDELVGSYQKVAERMVEMGLSGTTVYTSLVALIKELNDENEELIKLEERKIELHKETKASEAPKVPVELTFAKPDLAIDNLKKELKNKGDFKLKATVELLMSGDLKKGDKKFTADFAEVKKIIDEAQKSGKDVYATLVKEYNLSSDITKELEKQASLEETKSEARGIEKYKKMLEDLEGVNERLEDMNALGDLGGDSVSYGIYKIEAKAARAEAAVDKLVKQLRGMKGIDQGKVNEYEKNSKELISKEKLAEQESYLKSFVDNAKGYYNELREFRGEIGSAEVEEIKKKYDKELEALDKWHQTELEKYKEQEEKKAEITAQYEDLKKATEEKKNEDILRASDDMIGGLKLGLKDYVNSGKGAAGQIANVTMKGFESMGEALGNFVTSADKSWDSLAEGFADLAKSIVNDISKIIAKAMVLNTMKWALNDTPFGSFLGFADGGVVNTGLSSYSNGVYNTPTFFTTNGGGFQRYANGGVFGEAGPEAIMPLTRMPNGRLGVAATGGSGGGGDIQVNVYNNSNSKAEVRQSTSSSGGKSIDVIIGDMVAKQMSTPGSKLNRTVSTYTGGQQAVIRR